MFNIKFSQEQLQILNMALGEIPHKYAGPLIQQINNQILEQQESASAEPAGQKEVNPPDNLNSRTD